MPRSTRLRRALAGSVALLCAAGGLGLLAGPGTPAAAGTPSVTAAAGTPHHAVAAGPHATAYHLRVIEHNVSGVQSNHGGPTALDAVDRRIASRRVDAVMLNEVCQSQYTAFAHEHPTWSVRWHATGYRSPSVTQPGCLGDDDRIGELVGTPWSITGQVAYCLSPPDPTPYPGEPGPCDLTTTHDRYVAPVLGCYLIHVPHHSRTGLEVCTTHLPVIYGDDKAAADGHRAEWTTRMRAALHPAVTRLRRVVVLGGDFNSSPPRASLDQLYRTTRWGHDRGPGDFFEADETDRHHFHGAGKYVRCNPHGPVPVCRSGQSGSTKRGEKGKIDYIFFSRTTTDLATVHGEMTYPRDRYGRLSSEHRVYTGTATVQLKLARPRSPGRSRLG